MSNFVLLTLIGLVAGAGGGLLGIGGSTIMIPGMVLLLGPGRQHLYQAAAMIVNFFVVAPAVVQHRRCGAVFSSVTRWTVPGAVVGAVVGVLISDLPLFHGPGQGYLQIGFAAFLFYAAAYNLVRLGTGRRLPPMDAAAAAKLSRLVILLVVGFPAGFLGGLLGVGGGLVAVPAQQICLRIPLPNAIANSASTILWSSLVAAVVKNRALGMHGFTLAQSLTLVLSLAPAAIIGSWYTAARVHRWPVTTIRAAFVVLLTYGGAHLTRLGWKQLSSPPRERLTGIRDFAGPAAPRFRTPAAP